MHVCPTKTQEKDETSLTSTPLTVQSTHRIPHDNVDVCAEGVVDVLRYVEVDKVTEVVVHVHPCSENTHNVSQLR